jgi:hypothetical protein
VGLDQCDPGVPGHHHLHLWEELLALGLLLGGRLLVAKEAKLLAADLPCPNLRLRGHCGDDGLDFPESPWA